MMKTSINMTTEHRRDADATTAATLPITGMTCAACAARVEKVLSRTQGVKKAAVNFATGEARVEFVPAVTNVDALIGRVQDAGYGASAPSDGAAGDNGMEAEAAAYRALRRRF